MTKFVPYAKMSKKQRRELDKRQRRDWGGLNPATRPVDPDPKRYTRKVKHKNRALPEE